MNPGRAFSSDARFWFVSTIKDAYRGATALVPPTIVASPASNISHGPGVASAKLSGITRPTSTPSMADRLSIPLIFCHTRARIVRCSDSKIVGFTCMLGQKLASSALADRIESKQPETDIPLGLVNFERPMREALLRNFGQIAYMANDEAEKKSANGAGLASRQYGGVSPAGVIWRTERGQVRHTGFAPPLESMDWLPFPIYQDYFERMRQYAFAKQ